MGRPSKPWFWTARRRWAATVGGVRYIAPDDIGPRDEHAAWKWHAELLAGSTPRKASGLRLADLCEAYLAWDSGRVAAGQRDAKAATLLGYRFTRICRTLVGIRKAGSMRPEEIDAVRLEELLAAWSAEISAIYCRQLVIDLKTMFRWAAKSRGGRKPLLASNPLVDAPIPPLPPSEPRYATRAEAAAWLRFLWRQGLREFALLQRCLVYTGARPKELVTATWGDVRWDAHQSPGGHPLAVISLSRWKAARKTGKTRRVFLPARLVRSLRRRAAASGEPSALIWSAPRGGPWSSSNLATYTARQRDAAIDAKLPFKDEGPERLVNYRWRHTAASALIMSNVPLATVAAILGTSAKMLAQTYAHLLEGHLGDAAEQITRAGKGTR